MGRGTYKTNLLVLLAASALSLVIAELLVRHLFVTSPHESRYLMFSSPHFRLDSNKAVRYLPNELARSVAVYDGSIEYDVSYQTNNLGFIDHRDYNMAHDKEAVRRYVFVGNSFTAGVHGGEPWVPRLRDKVVSSGRSIEIYNLGVTGTGLEHFYRVLKSAAREIRFENIVIISLSSDFKREFWYPLVSDSQLRFCPERLAEEACLKVPPIATIFDHTASQENILDSVSSIRQHDTFMDSSAQFVRGQLKRSRFLVLLVRAVRNRHECTTELINGSLESLRKIRRDFNNMTVDFIHLPQKHEVAKGEYEIEVRGDIEGMGIKYFPALKECAWSKDMFHSRDSHPNSRGYQNISDCVSRYLSF